MFPGSTDPVFSAAEIQVIKNYILGGGRCVVVMDNQAVMPYYHVVDGLLDDLGASFSAMQDVNTTDPYTDITADPIMTNVFSLYGNVGGAWTIDSPLATSLARETGTSRTVIAKSPIVP